MPSQTNRLVYHFPGEAYVDDIGNGLSGVSSFIDIPADLTRTTAIQLIESFGAEELTENAPCSPAFDVKPRTVTFHRRSGSSIQVVAPIRAQLVAQVNTAVERLGGIENIKCISLKGEKYNNMIDILTTDQAAEKTPGAPIQVPDETPRARVMFKGTMTAYQTDVPWTRAGIQKGFSMKSNTANNPPPILQSTTDGCLGARISTSICSGVGLKFKSRRFEVKLLVQKPRNSPETPNGEYYQSLTIPIANRAQNSVLECGQALAALPSTICIKYMGETWTDISAFL